MSQRTRSRDPGDGPPPGTTGASPQPLLGRNRVSRWVAALIPLTAIPVAVALSLISSASSASTQGTPVATGTPTPPNPTTFSPNVGPAPTVTGTPPANETPVSLPDVPFAELRQAELVTLPGDAPVVPEPEAENTAHSWAVTYAGTDVAFTHVVLARLQDLDGHGDLYGPPGTLQWIFVNIGPTHLGPRMGPPEAAASTPDRSQTHFLIIGIDASTGQQDGTLSS